MPKKKNTRKPKSNSLTQPSSSYYKKSHKATVFVIALALIGGVALTAISANAPAANTPMPSPSVTESVIGETTVKTK